MNKRIDNIISPAIAKKTAPIVLFTYNRPEHTRLTVEALKANKYASESDLIVFSDGHKNDRDKAKVDEVRAYLKTITGFQSYKIIERKKNIGLAANIIDGVTQMVNEYGKIIVLEDDLITSPYFLQYMNEGLDLYEKEEDVISIHGYMYPVRKKLPETFFIKGADCWGWGTWRRGWDIFKADGQELLKELETRKLQREFDYNGSYPYTKMLKKTIKGEIGSWAIRWYASAFLNNKLTLYPGRSLVFHNGSDGSGINCSENSIYDVKLSLEPVNVSSIKIEESNPAKKNMIHHFRYRMKYIKIKSVIRNFFNRK